MSIHGTYFVFPRFHLRTVAYEEKTKEPNSLRHVRSLSLSKLAYHRLRDLDAIADTKLDINKFHTAIPEDTIEIRQRREDLRNLYHRIEKK